MYDVVEIKVGDHVGHNDNARLGGRVVELLGDNMVVIEPFSPLATKNVVINLTYWHKTR